MKPGPDYCDEAARLWSLSIIIDWQKVDYDILMAADLSHAEVGQNYLPIFPDNLIIVRGSMDSGRGGSQEKSS